MAKDKFNKMRAVFTDRKLLLNIKLRLIRTLISFAQSCCTERKHGPKTEKLVGTSKPLRCGFTVVCSKFSTSTVSPTRRFCNVCKWNDF